MLQNNFGAVIVAAGSSRRMGASQSKVLMNLAGRPVLSYSLDALCACPVSYTHLDVYKRQEKFYRKMDVFKTQSYLAKFPSLAKRPFSTSWQG